MVTLNKELKNKTLSYVLEKNDGEKKNVSSRKVRTPKLSSSRKCILEKSLMNFMSFFSQKLWQKCGEKRTELYEWNVFFFFFLEKIVRGDAEQGKKNPLIHNSLTT